MTPRWYSPQAPELVAVSLKCLKEVLLIICVRTTVVQVRSRGLPDDFEGSEVRVVEVEGLDSNMCCGTHVPNLSHLQVSLTWYSSKRD